MAYIDKLEISGNTWQSLKDVVEKVNEIIEALNNTVLEPAAEDE
jgi:hypothetical protein